MTEERNNERKGSLAVTETASAEGAPAESDPDGAREWYDGEDGPCTSTEAERSTNAQTSLAEEERLNAIIQNKVSG